MTVTVSTLHKTPAARTTHCDTMTDARVVSFWRLLCAYLSTGRHQLVQLVRAGAGHTALAQHLIWRMQRQREAHARQVLAQLHLGQ